MKVFSIGTIFIPIFLNSCALITTPVKVVGKAATTTMDVTGKVVGSSIDVITPGSNDDDDEKSKESE